MLRACILVTILISPQFKPQKLPGVPEPMDRKVAPDRSAEGWLVRQSGDPLASTLVISRNAHEVNRFAGEPYILSWDFWRSGAQVVYQTGAAHGRTTCILAESASGRVLATEDWCNRPDGNGPDWTRPVLN